jgi:type IV pilus assembly protein PilF
MITGCGATTMAVRWAMVALVMFGLLTGCGGMGTKGDIPSQAGDSPADLYVEMAAEYLRLGQLDAAFERGRQAIAQDNGNARAHYIMALIYQRLEETESATKEFQTAMRLAPDDPVFLNAWGTVLCTRGKYSEALAHFEQALEDPLYSTPELALTNAADCARRAGRSAQSEAFLSRALKRNPLYPPALLAMARRVYDRGDYQAARGYLSRYGQVGQPSPSVLLLAAQVERKLGNAANAKKLEAALRERYPDAPEALQL